MMLAVLSFYTSYRGFMKSRKVVVLTLLIELDHISYENDEGT
jgi:hypothetical protein